MREACFCGAMGKGFREEMASEDAGRVSERRILLTMYEELLWPTLGHVHQDLAEKTSRGAMPGIDVLWGGSPTGPRPMWKGDPTCLGILSTHLSSSVNSA